MTFINETFKKLGLGPIIKRLIKKRNGFVDQRRFWKGEILESPASNVSLFRQDGKRPVVLTYEKESRDCIFIKSGASYELHLPKQEKYSEMRLSFASEGTPSLDESIRVSHGEKEIGRLSYIIPRKWHTLKINLHESDKKFLIQNTCKTDISMAHPVLIQAFNNTAGAQKQPKNVIMIILDSLWRDSVGIYNDESIKYTPNINHFFRNGIKYLNGFTQSEWTYPSVYSFLTSQYPVGHGMNDLHRSSSGMLSYGGENLAEKFRQMGYSTLAYSTVKIFHPGFSGHIGFDRFLYDPFPQSSQTHLDICRKAVEQLIGNKEGKNFLFLHFLDTHEPWSHPSDFEDNFLSNFRITDAMKEYESLKRGDKDTKAEPIFDNEGIETLTQRRNGRLFNVDLSLQFLFDYLERSGELENTVVALCSDHGYQYLAETRPLFCNTRVNVPLVLYHPNFNQQTVEDLVAVNLDLGPTLVKFCGGNYKSDGSILPPFDHGKTRGWVISESIFGSLYKVAIRDHMYVYHFCCRYDIEKNKIVLRDVKDSRLVMRNEEKKNVDISAGMPDIVEKMGSILHEHLSKFYDILD